MKQIGKEIFAVSVTDPVSIASSECGPLSTADSEP